MNWKTIVLISVVALAALLALFEIRVNLQFSLPGERQQADPEQEASFAACYAERDREIHDVAFGTIDNPDVQKLYIRNNRDQAASECRQRFPEQMVTVEEPFRFKVFDLRFRY